MSKSNKTESTTAIATILGIVILLGFSTPHLESVFTDTMPIGSDLGSHYFAVRYLKEVLLPDWRIFGWDPGAFGGYPILQFYHFVPFLIIIAMSTVMPLTVAFKLMVYLSSFAIPLGAYFGLRLMRFRPYVAALAAVFATVGLFHREHAIYGGNLASQFAGEFCFTLANGLLPIYLAMLYRGIITKRSVVTNGLLLTLIAFTHLVTFGVAAGTAAVFLFCRRTIPNLIYLTKVNGLAFLLTAGWLVPTFFKRGYTEALVSKRDWVNDIKTIYHLFPRLLLPCFVIVLIYLVYSLLKRKTRSIRFYIFGMAAAVGVFLFATGLIGWAGRFPPLVGVLVSILAAICLNSILRHSRAAKLHLLYLSILALVVILHNPSFYTLRGSSGFFFQGMEVRPGWNDFKQLYSYMDQKIGNFRIIAENAEERNPLARRSFEYIPYLTKNVQGMEGVYTPGALGRKFELAVNHSIFNNNTLTPSALLQLREYNIGWVVTVTEKNRLKFANSKDFEHVFKVAFYNIFKFKSARESWVDVIEAPVSELSLPINKWIEDSVEWLKALTEDSGLFIYSKVEQSQLKNISNGTNNKLVAPLKFKEDCIKGLTLAAHEISFNTSCLNQAHIIRVSYFPDWNVIGADQVFLVSPGLMLIYPTANQVRLYYSRDGYNQIGNLLSLLGFIILGYCGVTRLCKLRNRTTPVLMLPISKLQKPRAFSSRLLSLVILLFIFIVMPLKYYDLPNYLAERKIYNKAVQEIQSGDFSNVKKHIAQLKSKHFKNEANYLLVRVSYHNKDYPSMRNPLYSHVNALPKSERTAEMRYYYSLSKFEQKDYPKMMHEVFGMNRAHPTSPWTAKVNVFFADWKKANPELYEQYKHEYK